MGRIDGTSEVVKMLIKLEATFEELTSISCDAGPNLFKENMNPLVATQDGEIPRRLLGKNHRLHGPT